MCQFRSYIQSLYLQTVSHSEVMECCMAGKQTQVSATWNPAGTTSWSTYLQSYFGIIGYTKSVIIWSAFNLLQEDTTQLLFKRVAQS